VIVPARKKSQSHDFGLSKSAKQGGRIIIVVSGRSFDHAASETRLSVADVKGSNITSF
jgi:hypothetical protein